MIAEIAKKAGLDYVLARLHSPAGLGISAKSPGEVVLNILVEVFMFLKNASGKPMMEVKDPRKLLKEALKGRIQETTCNWKPTHYKL